MNRKCKGKRPKPHRYIPLVVAAVLAICAFAGCAGAPKDRADFEEMPTERFDNWVGRVGAVHEEAAFALVSHAPSNVETVDRVIAAYAALTAQPIPAGALGALAEDPAFSGLLRLAILELGAVVGSDEHGMTPRLKALLDASAAGLAAGKNRALSGV